MDLKRKEIRQRYLKNLEDNEIEFFRLLENHNFRKSSSFGFKIGEFQYNVSLNKDTRAFRVTLYGAPNGLIERYGFIFGNPKTIIYDNNSPSGREVYPVNWTSLIKEYPARRLVE